MQTGTLLPATGQVVKLGRRRGAAVRPTLRFGSFLVKSPPSPPTHWDGRGAGIRWPMYANDQWGDCVFACIGHMLGLWTLDESGKEVLFTDSEVVQWYSAVTGFDPRRPWTDQGAVIQDALDYWTSKGYSKHMLAGYLTVEPNNVDHARLAAFVFGGLDLGVMLPAAWQHATGPGLVWDVGPNQNGAWAPGSWGGHSVPVVQWDYEGLTVVTWGKEQRMSWAALARYCDEVWAPVSWEWCVDDTTPSGVRKQDLIDTFTALGGGPLAPPPTPPAPPVPPVPPVPPPPPVPGGDSVDVVLGGHRYSSPATWTPAPGGEELPSPPGRGE